jgi:Trk K+ transport system NAD-binding subunit
MKDHIIICGLGHVGYRIAELLHALGEPFAVLTRELRPEWRDTLLAWTPRFVEGDGRQEANLRAAGVLTARVMLIVTDSDLENIEIALDVQRLNPGLTLIVRVFDPYLQDRIERLTNVRNVFNPAMLTAPVFVAAALGEEMMRVFTIRGCQVNIVRLPFLAQTYGVGMSLQDFCMEHNLIPIALHRQDNALSGLNDLKLSKSPLLSTHEPTRIVPDCPIQIGDELIAAVSGPDTERLWQAGHLPGSHPSLWEKPTGPGRIHTSLRGLLRRARTVDEIWRRTTPVLQGAVKAILALTFASAVLFRFTLKEVDSWSAALYFVITIMTTVGFGDYNFRDAPPWLKLYGCVMMISGLTLMTILISIVTDYIVTLRVEQSLGRRPTRLTNHVVVVGLGDVGSRIVQELRRMRVPVVAIERTPEQEAVPELQDQVQVIVADANRDSTMRLANVPKARAIIVTITSDLDSLLVAHRAERMNTRLRSVMRLYDSQLARKLGGEFGLESSVNAAAVAAATFVAAALETQVAEGFTLDRRLFMLRWLYPDDPQHAKVAGRTIREARVAGCAALLKASRNQMQSHAVPVALDDRIAPDDCLLVLEEYLPAKRTAAAPDVLPGTEEEPLPSDTVVLQPYPGVSER